MDGSYWLKLTITLLTFVLALIEFDIFKLFKKKKHRRRTVGTIFIILILVTVWDNTKESIDTSKEEVKRDSLIKVESLRAIRIMETLKINLDKLEITSDEVGGMNRILNGVRDSLQNQVIVLREIVDRTKEVSKLEKEKFKSEEAELFLHGGSFEIITFESDTTSIQLHYLIENIGKRTLVGLNEHILLLGRKIDGGYEVLNNVATTNKQIIYNTTSKEKVAIHYSKHDFVNLFQEVIFIFKSTYMDNISKQNKNFNEYYVSKITKGSVILNFNNISLSQETKNPILNLNNFLIENNLTKYQIELNDLGTVDR